MRWLSKTFPRFLFLLVISASGCNNAFVEIDTDVKLIEGSTPPKFEITGNGTSPIFLMFGPYEGDYGKDGNPPALWEIGPKPEAQGIRVDKYSPLVYGHIPAGYAQNKPKTSQIPALLEGKEYHFYVHVNSANGDGVCFRIQNQKAVLCQ